MIKFVSWLRMLKRKVLMSFRTIFKPETVSILGIKIPLGNLSGEPLKAIYEGWYELLELNIVRRNLSQDDRVMELGTGLGLVSSFCAKSIGSDKVFTYEANPALIPYIQNIYEVNHVNPHFQSCMLGEVPGEQTFYISQDFWSSSSLQTDTVVNKIKVPVFSLNEEIYKINPSFLIVDIEGGEYDLLQYLDFYNIKKISIELHEDIIGFEKADFVRNRLLAAGFLLDSKSSYERELFFYRETT